MNLDKVKAMSNKDLRIKAAELVGFTDIRLRLIPVPWLMDLVEEELSGYLDGAIRCIPDYPNDIAAAMKLWPLILIKNPMGALHLVRTPTHNSKDWREAMGYGFAIGICGGPTREEWEYIGLTIEEKRIGDVDADVAARAITRAFVLTKVQEGEK